MHYVLWGHFIYPESKVHYALWGHFIYPESKVHYVLWGHFIYPESKVHYVLWGHFIHPESKACSVLCLQIPVDVELCHNIIFFTGSCRERLVQQIQLGSLALVLGQNCMQSGSGFRDMLMKRKSIGERRGWVVGGYRLGGGLVGREGGGDEQA